MASREAVLVVLQLHGLTDKLVSHTKSRQIAPTLLIHNLDGYENVLSHLAREFHALVGHRREDFTRFPFWKVQR